MIKVKMTLLGSIMMLMLGLVPALAQKQEQECVTKEAVVQVAYRQILGRQKSPGADEVNNAVKQLNGGASVFDLMKNMVQSPGVPQCDCTTKYCD